MTKTTITRFAAAGVASVALIASAACNGNGLDTVRAEQRDPRLLQTAANGSALGNAAVGNQQMLVNCGPYQRTLVRTTYLNGQPVASVDCVPAENAAPAGYVAQSQFAPVAAQPVVYQTAPAPRVVRTVASAPRTQTVYRETAAVRRAPVRSKTKSAVIIGTSAPAGAGVGALIGGKKGAIIGAVAGGGGAAVWDQVTRRQKQ